MPADPPKPPQQRLAANDKKKPKTLPKPKPTDKRNV